MNDDNVCSPSQENKPFFRSYLQVPTYYVVGVTPELVQLAWNFQA